MIGLCPSLDHWSDRYGLQLVAKRLQHPAHLRLGGPMRYAQDHRCGCAAETIDIGELDELTLMRRQRFDRTANGAFVDSPRVGIVVNRRLAGGDKGLSTAATRL